MKVKLFRIKMFGDPDMVNHSIEVPVGSILKGVKVIGDPDGRAGIQAIYLIPNAFIAKSGSQLETFVIGKPNEEVADDLEYIDTIDVILELSDEEKAQYNAAIGTIIIPVFRLRRTALTGLSAN